MCVDMTSSLLLYNVVSGILSSPALPQTMELEPLAIEYTWGESQTEANTFHFQEKYKGKAGFEAHQQAPHFKRWEEFVQSDPFTKAPEVMLFEEA
eukprot:jgi/Bigna1/146517/aug1.116_g21225